MSADWNEPTVNSTYTDVIDDLKERDLDAARQLDTATVTVTNPQNGMIRWNSSSAKWQKYNSGTATWTDLTTTYAISISGTAGSVAWGNVTGKPTTLSGYNISDAQPLDADLTALAGLSTTGLVARTGSGTATTRTLTAPSAGLTISNADGVSGNPTFALANDLLALENLASTGIAVRTATSTWAQRTIIGPAAGITVTNGNGVSGNPTLALANDLAALEGLASTGIPERTATDTWTLRSVSGNGKVDAFPSGTRLLFQQSAAPTGWTKETSATYNDAALRIVTGSAATGGADAFSTHFGTGKTTAGHTLATTEIPSHSHSVSDPGHGHGVSDPGHAHVQNMSATANAQSTWWRAGAALPSVAAVEFSLIGTSNIPVTTDGSVTGISVSAATTGISVGNTGGGAAHSHTLNNFNIKYVDSIIASKT